jgi:hypothetical protein
MMPVETSERQNILEKVDNNWSELVETLQSFSEGELTTPNVIGIWSLKDLIGHLETWDRIAITKLDRAERGISTSWWKDLQPQYASIDEFNEADADHNRHKSIAQLWTELHAAHGELVERIKTSDALTAELIHEDTYTHYAGHLNDIHAWQQGH